MYLQHILGADAQNPDYFKMAVDNDLQEEIKKREKMYRNATLPKF